MTTLIVTIYPAQGDYQKAPTSRKSELRVVSEKTPYSVSLNNSILPKFKTASSFDTSDSGWFFDATKKIVFAKAASMPVETTENICLHNGHRQISVKASMILSALQVLAMGGIPTILHACLLVTIARTEYGKVIPSECQMRSIN